MSNNIVDSSKSTDFSISQEFISDFVTSVFLNSYSKGDLKQKLYKYVIGHAIGLATKKGYEYAKEKWFFKNHNKTISIEMSNGKLLDALSLHMAKNSDKKYNTYTAKVSDYSGYQTTSSITSTGSVEPYYSSADDFQKENNIHYIPIPTDSSMDIAYKGVEFNFFIKPKTEYSPENKYVISVSENHLLLLKEFLEMVLSDYLKHIQQEKNIFLYILTSKGYWRQLKVDRGRRLESVILPENLKDNIVSRVQTFIDDEAWYIDRGIPYRLGILLYGPPGTGKSSLVKAIATYTGKDVYQVIINSGLDDTNFIEALSEVPRGSIILIEDIDRINKSNISISETTLLNGIDGLVAQQGSILFVTTNHIEKLNDALKREGRMDHKYYMGACDFKQIENMFKLFYPDNQEMANQFATSVWGDETLKDVRPSKLASYFSMYRNQPNYALQNTHELADVSDIDEELEKIEMRNTNKHGEVSFSLNMVN